MPQLDPWRLFPLPRPCAAKRLQHALSSGPSPVPSLQTHLFSTSPLKAQSCLLLTTDVQAVGPQRLPGRRGLPAARRGAGPGAALRGLPAAEAEPRVRSRSAAPRARPLRRAARSLPCALPGARRLAPASPGKGVRSPAGKRLPRAGHGQRRRRRSVPGRGAAAKRLEPRQRQPRPRGDPAASPGPPREAASG